MPDHPHRHIKLDGATNFRDLGGYRTNDGRFVRWRKLFRSEHLAGLSAADLKRLAAYGITRTLDFRGEAERAATPYELPGVIQHSLAIEPTVAQELAELMGSAGGIDAREASRLMERLYVHLVDEQSERFAQFFEHLLDIDDQPVLFHCTAGKDRTGMAAALLLLALGVPREVVDHDYLLTNDLYRRAPSAIPSEFPADVLDVLWKVQPSYLTTAFETIERRHGGLQNYLSERLRLGKAARATLAERYLTTSGDFRGDALLR